MKIFFSLIKREFKLFTGNRIMVMLYIGGPVIYGLMFGAVYTKGKLTDLPIMVVDKDNSPMSTKFIDMLNDIDVLKVKEVKYESADMQKIFVGDNIYAAVVIPKGFEADVVQKKHPEINTYINNTNLLPSGYVTRSISTAAGNLNAAAILKSGKQYEALHLNTFRLYNPASNYFMYIWPSYLAIILQAVVMVVLALSVTSEYERNSLTELYIKSGSALGMMAAKIVHYSLISAIILAIYGAYFYLFKQRLPSQLGQAIFISALFIASISFMGMIGGLLFKTQLKAIQFLMILSMPAYMASGFSWPYNHYGFGAKLFGAIFPIMPFINGFRILLIEHGTLNDIKDYLTLQVLQLVFYFLLAWIILIFKIKELLKPIKEDLENTQQ